MSKHFHLNKPCIPTEELEAKQANLEITKNHLKTAQADISNKIRQISGNLWGFKHNFVEDSDDLKSPFESTYEEAFSYLPKEELKLLTANLLNFFDEYVSSNPQKKINSELKQIHWRLKQASQCRNNKENYLKWFYAGKESKKITGLIQDYINDPENIPQTLTEKEKIKTMGDGFFISDLVKYIKLLIRDYFEKPVEYQSLFHCLNEFIGIHLQTVLKDDVVHRHYRRQ